MSKEGIIGNWSQNPFLTPNMSSDVRSQFSFFADHLSASMLNLFESISYQKVIFAQSWGHKEAIWTPEQPKYAHNSPFPEAESNESPCISDTIPETIPETTLKVSLRLSLRLL